MRTSILCFSSSVVIVGHYRQIRTISAPPIIESKS